MLQGPAGSSKPRLCGSYKFNCAMKYTHFGKLRCSQLCAYSVSGVQEAGDRFEDVIWSSGILQVSTQQMKDQ